MGDLIALTTKIQNFFELVEEHDKQIEDWIKETKKPSHSIINQSAVLRAVISDDPVEISGFEKLPDFREKLLMTIVYSLREEVFLLTDIRNKIDAATDVLYQEQKSIESLYLDLRTKNLIDYSKLNPCSPSLDHIVTWCSDAWRFYHLFYVQVSQALSNLDFENEDSVNALPELLKKDFSLEKPVKKIRSFDFSHFEFINH